MTSIKSIPFKYPRGPMDWASFGQWFDAVKRDQLRLMDIRDPQQEPLYGRAAILPAIVTNIGDTGSASSQRLLPMLNVGGKFSTQSVQPLTATDAGATATINIAAHNLICGSGVGVVVYNPGSITGLAFSTLYYVYADDPTIAGGAVTYLATTNANTATANDGRYYVGKVTTPADGGGDIGGGWGGGGGGGGNPIP